MPKRPVGEPKLSSMETFRVGDMDNNNNTASVEMNWSASPNGRHVVNLLETIGVCKVNLVPLPANVLDTIAANGFYDITLLAQNFEKVNDESNGSDEEIAVEWNGAEIEIETEVECETMTNMVNGDAIEEDVDRDKFHRTNSNDELVTVERSPKSMERDFTVTVSNLHKFKLGICTTNLVRLPGHILAEIAANGFYQIPVKNEMPSKQLLTVKIPKKSSKNKAKIFFRLPTANTAPIDGSKAEKKPKKRNERDPIEDARPPKTASKRQVRFSIDENDIADGFQSLDLTNVVTKRKRCNALKNVVSIWTHWIDHEMYHFIDSFRSFCSIADESG